MVNELRKKKKLFSPNNYLTISKNRIYLLFIDDKRVFNETVNNLHFSIFFDFC